MTASRGETEAHELLPNTEQETDHGLHSVESPGHTPSEEVAGPEVRAGPAAELQPPLLVGASPWLTCDGAVVVIPWDPGQPHTSLGQVSELQVPGSVRSSWRQREGPLESELARSPSYRQDLGRLSSPRRDQPQPVPEGQPRGHPALGVQGRTKRKDPRIPPAPKEYQGVQGAVRIGANPPQPVGVLGVEAFGKGSQL